MALRGLAGKCCSASQQPRNASLSGDLSADGWFSQERLFEGKLVACRYAIYLLQQIKFRPRHPFLSSIILFPPAHSRNLVCVRNQFSGRQSPSQIRWVFGSCDIIDVLIIDTFGCSYGLSTTLSFLHMHHECKMENQFHKIEVRLG